MLLGVTIAANISRLHSTVRDVVVDIKHSNTPQLVSEQTVKDSILAALPHLAATRVADVDAARTVKSVTYCDAAGRMSNRPYNGLNIVVTRYTDGSTSTSKVVR